MWVYYVEHYKKRKKVMERYFIISVLYIYVSLSIDLYIILMHIYIYISCTSCTQGNELPQSHYSDNWEGTLVSWLHIYAHFASVRFEHSVCHRSLMTIYDH